MGKKSYNKPEIKKSTRSGSGMHKKSFTPKLTVELYVVVHACKSSICSMEAEGSRSSRLSLATN